jgi:hypothetical protein
MMGRKGHRTSEIIGDDVTVIGAYSSRTLTQEEEAVVLSLAGRYHSVCLFKRLRINQQIVHCVEYRSTTRRDNTVICFRQTCFGKVQSFMKVTCADGNNLFVVVVKVMERNATPTPNHRDRGSLNSHLVILNPPSDGLQAIHVQDISEVCICVQSSDKLFVSKAPNKVERE